MDRLRFKEGKWSVQWALTTEAGPVGLRWGLASGGYVSQSRGSGVRGTWVQILTQLWDLATSFVEWDKSNHLTGSINEITDVTGLICITLQLKLLEGRGWFHLLLYPQSLKHALPRVALSKCMLNGWMQHMALIITLILTYYCPEYFLVQLQSPFLFFSWTPFSVCSLYWCVQGHSCTHAPSHLHVPRLHCLSASSNLQGERENREAESKPSLSYPTHPPLSVQIAAPLHISEILATLL